MRLRLVALLGILGLVASACGGDHSGHTASGGASSTRTVNVKMRDIAYAPETVAVKKGETVRFLFTNEGKAPHDAFIGDEAAQTQHEGEMSSSVGGMEHGDHGSDANAITVQPGKTGELEHTFSAVASTIIGCHQPGHYAAGMKLTVTVT